jgi:hypothetical protein
VAQESKNCLQAGGACGKRASDLRPDYVTGNESSPVGECPENVPVDCNLLLETTTGSLVVTPLLVFSMT